MINHKKEYSLMNRINMMIAILKMDLEMLNQRKSVDNLKAMRRKKIYKKMTTMLKEMKKMNNKFNKLSVNPFISISFRL